jgi:Uma2 family endonuclease
MSDANDWEEMHEKRALYREAGAEEVWIVDRDGQIQVFRDHEREQSDLVPGFPSSL